MEVKKMRKAIEEVINSDFTIYKIAKESRLATSTISELRSGKRKIGNLTLDTIEKIYQFYLKNF